MTEMKSNKKGTGRGFFSRSLLLIVSFVIALVLWYMGTMQNQTQIARIYSDIPVKFINEDALSDLSLTAQQLKNVKVDAVLKGYFSDMNEINEEELVAVIDLSEQRFPGKYTVTPSVAGCSADISVSRIGNVDIVIEKIIKKQLNIDIEIQGVPADGYYIDKENIHYQKTVDVTCGASISRNIAGAKIVIDATGRKSDFDVNLNIILLDPQGKEADSSRVKLQQYSVSVRVAVAAYAQTGE